MITAIDTSVLIAIAKAEPTAEGWVGHLVGARRAGRLVICDVVAAEYFSLVLDSGIYMRTMDGLGIEFDAVTPAAAFEAGRIFHAYRKQGGPREHLLPDFLVGAHASVQTDQLAADDRGYLRRYFPDLKLLQP